jgi:methylmalonyl-CoA/ethylmalonyl-CoA epimerase
MAQISPADAACDGVRRDRSAGEWLVKATLDHVGIAIDGLDDALSFYRDALGLEIELEEDVPSQQVRVHFLGGGAAEGARLELIEASAASSPVARFLERRGPGLHHVALRVDDLPAVLAALAARGVRLIDESPRPGAHGTVVAFVHPASTQGVLVELVQRT